MNEENEAEGGGFQPRSSRTIMRPPFWVDLIGALRAALYEEGYSAMTVDGDLLPPSGHASTSCCPEERCWVCKAKSALMLAPRPGNAPKGAL